jgi:hypothetical protein
LIADRTSSRPLRLGDLSEFIIQLLQQEPIEIERRLKYVNLFTMVDFRDELPDGVSPNTDSPRFRFSHSTYCPYEGWNNYSCPLNNLSLYSDYLRAALLPLQTLEDNANAGDWSDPEKEAHDAADAEGLEYYNLHIHPLSLKMSESEIEGEPAASRIAKLLPLVQQSLEMDVPLNAAKHWELGWHVDKLTGAMVRAKQFVDAATILERFYALPKAYRHRLPPGLDKKLRARLARNLKAES